MINALAKEIHANSVSKGFKHDNIPTMLILAISELTEAMEADRNYRIANIRESEQEEAVNNASYFEAYVKDTFEDELVDAMIRIMDIAESRGIDLEFHIRAKMNYNATREFKHGNKKY